MENVDSQCSTPQSSAEGQPKLTASQRNRVRLQRLKESLGSLRHQLAFTVPQAGVTCGKSPSWAYRRIYDGTFRVTNEGGRLMILASEISHFLAGASKYNPTPKDPKNGGEPHQLGSHDERSA